MADDNGMTSRPRKRTCVALADNAPDEADRDGHVVIGKCVSDGAVKRSALLSGVVDAEGLASLPGHISLEDVRLWETACLVGGCFPTDELVTVVKVADALGDNKESVSKWLTTLAQRAVETDWQQQPQADATLASLLRLPDHLLCDAMAACAGRASLSNLLTSFPHCLHPHIVLSAVGTDGILDISCKGALNMLAVLPHTVFPPPGLRGLHIGMDSQEQGSSGGSSAVPALLARAAVAHTAITSLHLTTGGRVTEAPLPPRWLHTLAVGLRPGALPRLADLRLRIASRSDVCAELAACLRHLPALTSLTVGLAVSPGSESDMVSLQTYSGLGAVRASLPLLQRLSIEEGFNEALSDDDDASVLHHDVPSTGFPPLLSLMSVESVTKLVLNLTTILPSLQEVVSQAERFKCLKVLEVSARLNPENCLHSCAVAMMTINQLRGGLPVLETAKVCSRCPASPVFLAAAVATLAAKSLTSLTIGFDNSDPLGDGCFVEGVYVDGAVSQALRGWDWLSMSLGGCSRLRALTVDALGCGLGHEMAFSCYLARSLLKLPQLQHLTLVPVDSEMPMRLEAEFPRALAQLTALETLTFEHEDYGCPGRDGPMRFTFRSVPHVLQAIGKLKRLTDLQLCFNGVTRPLLAELLEQLPSLQYVYLLEEEFHSGGGPSGDHEAAAWDALHKRFAGVWIVSIHFKC